MVAIGCAFKNKLLERINNKTFKGVTYTYQRNFGGYHLFKVDSEDENKALRIIANELENDYNFKGMFLAFDVIDENNKIKYN